MVISKEQTEFKLDEVTLEYIKDYSLLVGRTNDVVTSLVFKDHADTGKGFYVSGATNLNAFIKLLMEFVEVRRPFEYGKD